MTGYDDRVEPAADEPGPELAGWGARAGAIVIDNLLLGIPLALGAGLALAAAAADSDVEDASSLWIAVVLLFVVGIFGPFVYFGVLNGNDRGQTIGKRATKIRVCKRDGSPLGVWRAVGRYAFTWVIGFFVGPLIVIDYLWPLWDSQNQTLHDKVVDSIVVKV